MYLFFLSFLYFFLFLLFFFFLDFSLIFSAACTHGLGGVSVGVFVTLGEPLPYASRRKEDRILSAWREEFHLFWPRVGPASLRRGRFLSLPPQLGFSYFFSPLFPFLCWLGIFFHKNPSAFTIWSLLPKLLLKGHFQGAIYNKKGDTKLTYILI